MSVLDEIDAIQAELEEPLTTVPERLLSVMDYCSVQIARVTEMRDDAVEFLTRKKKMIAIQNSEIGSAARFKLIVEGDCAAEQKLVDRLESILRSLTKKFDAAQSSLSWQKADSRRQP